MWSLLWILIFSAFSAVWFVTSGYLAYAWSDGDEKTQTRFAALFLAVYFLIVYAFFMY